uniref:Uncharacterized protein n=1 Tax=Rhizophora mucronata TaxID=61149 RepID=A0A2P2NPC3_RHIMU
MSFTYSLVYTQWSRPFHVFCLNQFNPTLVKPSNCIWPTTQFKFCCYTC